MTDVYTDVYTLYVIIKTPYSIRVSVIQEYVYYSERV